jgi:hypothetical protein
MLFHIAFGTEAYILESAACAPLDALERRIGEVAQRVDSRAEWYTTASWRAVRVLVVGIERSMEVEVFLHVDDGEVVLREQLPNARCVCGLVAGDLVAVENWGKTRYIEGRDIERACCLCDGRRNGRQNGEEVLRLTHGEEKLRLICRTVYEDRRRSFSYIYLSCQSVTEMLNFHVNVPLSTIGLRTNSIKEKSHA